MQITKLVKRIASHLPLSTQNAMKRLHFARQIRHSTFFTDEAEFSRLEEWVTDGDWVIDVGANIGASALFFASICPRAKIFAFEPAEEPYRLLQKNTELCRRIAAYNFGMFSSDREVPLYKGGHDCVTACASERRRPLKPKLRRPDPGWMHSAQQSQAPFVAQTRRWRGVRSR